jgi:competence protein ComEC
LYDTGPRFSESFDAATAAIIPYLRSRGIAAPDLVVVGHGDSDHRGGLPTLRAAHLLTAGLVSQHAAAYFPEASYCQVGQHWRWEGVDFTVLHPTAGYTSSSENDASCVIQVRAGLHSLLLSGDIESGAERTLVERWGSQLQSDVLVVPHHGSRTSSTPLFIDTVDPDVAVVAAGFLNRHGHPKPDIISRYLERGISVWSTAQHGAITLALGASDAPIAAHGYRARGRYYWHRNTGEVSAHRF